MFKYCSCFKSEALTVPPPAAIQLWTEERRFNVSVLWFWFCRRDADEFHNVCHLWLHQLISRQINEELKSYIVFNISRRLPVCLSSGSPTVCIFNHLWSPAGNRKTGGEVLHQHVTERSETTRHVSPVETANQERGGLCRFCRRTSVWWGWTEEELLNVPECLVTSGTMQKIKSLNIVVMMMEKTRLKLQIEKQSNDERLRSFWSIRRFELQLRTRERADRFHLLLTFYIWSRL